MAPSIRNATAARSSIEQLFLTSAGPRERRSAVLVCFREGVAAPSVFHCVTLLAAREARSATTANDEIAGATRRATCVRGVEAGHQSSCRRSPCDDSSSSRYHFDQETPICAVVDRRRVSPGSDLRLTNANGKMMGSKRGRGGTGSGNPERVRTHLFFSSQPERQHQKRKRRTHNKLHSTSHKKDEMVQAGASEIDPLQWTGNQRVLHFGPMAQRDPYFYYYPKGWDVLYPAQFGFFPYRTKKFRGSSSLICCTAFGVFLVIGGLLMSFLGYRVLHDSPFWTWPGDQSLRPPPIQIAGPVLFVVGSLLLFSSLVYTICTTKLCDLSLHHTQKHNEPSRVTTITTHYVPLPPIFDKDPYQPLPPPAYPVLENKYAQSNVVRPHDEKKLYPPVIPGCSTLSLHRKSPNNIFVASPYNTLRATSVAKYQTGFLDTTSVLENRFGSRTTSVASRRQSSEVSSQKRSKSMGPLLHRTGSNRSSNRSRRRENSQL